ncbi:hypothetical protein [Paraburkholderia bryophila]|uniref:Uncharacterized protein n=1 Tax=Paraburkholderia bryophila TaxID=420952 RepID=A0A7Z0AYJ3_9BURK|nr:hypothetical protein [Paraburkholderia bryophila]NYH13550.1 hypothetical protein [Paraburkholderia bryophila]
MADQSSGRNEFNAGSDSAKHHGKTAYEQHQATPKAGPATPTTGPRGSVVRDEKPSNVPGSAVRS